MAAASMAGAVPAAGQGPPVQSLVISLDQLGAAAPGGVTHIEVQCYDASSFEDLGSVDLELTSGDERVLQDQADFGASFAAGAECRVTSESLDAQRIGMLVTPNEGPSAFEYGQGTYPSFSIETEFEATDADASAAVDILQAFPPQPICDRTDELIAAQPWIEQLATEKWTGTPRELLAAHFLLYADTTTLTFPWEYFEATSERERAGIEQVSNAAAVIQVALGDRLREVLVPVAFDLELLSSDQMAVVVAAADDALAQWGALVEGRTLMCTQAPVDSTTTTTTGPTSSGRPPSVAAAVPRFTG